MKNKHILTAIFSGLMLFGMSAGSALSCLSSSEGQDVLISKKNKLTPRSAINPDEYEEASNTKLLPKIKKCTSTSLSKHFDVEFESILTRGRAGRKKDVYIAINDPNFSGQTSDPFIEDPGDDRSLDGFTCHAERTSQTGKVLYIPNKMERGTSFVVDNKIIAEGTMTNAIVKNNTGSEAREYDSLDEICIGDAIEKVEKGAFINVPASVKFTVYGHDSLPEGWDPEWTDATNIEYNPTKVSELSGTKKTNLTSFKDAGNIREFGVAEDFILGYKGNDEEGDKHIDPYPLTMMYDKIHADGTRETVQEELAVKHKTMPYDAVGSSIYGSTNTFSINIDFEKGEDVDVESIKFYNVFEVDRVYTDELSEWPQKEIKTIVETWNGIEYLDVEDNPVVPVLEGDDFSTQFYEKTDNAYLTTSVKRDDAVAAKELLDSYKAMLDEDAAKAEEGEEDYYYHPVYDETHEIDKFEQYGYVYEKNFKVSGSESPSTILLQFYTYDEYFITYVYAYMNEKETIEQQKVDDDGNPVYKVDDDGNFIYEDEEQTKKIPVMEKVIVDSPVNKIDIQVMQEAVKPFYFVPKLEKNEQGQVIGGKLFSESKKNFKKITHVDDILSIDYKKASTFMGYTSISLNIDKVLSDIYVADLKDSDGNITERKFVLKEDSGDFYDGNKKLEPGTFELVKNEKTGEDLTIKGPREYIADRVIKAYADGNLKDIIAGKIVFRYIFNGFNTSHFVVKYQTKGGVVEKNIPIHSPSPVSELTKTKGNKVTFMVNSRDLEGVPTSKILFVGISGMTVNIHLYQKGKNPVVIQNTQFDNVFGNIELYPETGRGIKAFNINLYLIFFFLALTAVYAVGAVGLYFYKKNKYKNDEFRRMRTKQYVKSSIIGFVGLALVAAMINFVFFRFFVFNSSVPTFNPIDPFVIVFGISGFIALGFFIRNAVVAYKINKKRKVTKRLRLDKDVVEDGTH